MIHFRKVPQYRNWIIRFQLRNIDTAGSQKKSYLIPALEAYMITKYVFNELLLPHHMCKHGTFAPCSVATDPVPEVNFNSWSYLFKQENQPVNTITSENIHVPWSSKASKCWKIRRRVALAVSPRLQDHWCRDVTKGGGTTGSMSPPELRNKIKFCSQNKKVKKWVDPDPKNNGPNPKSFRFW